MHVGHVTVARPGFGFVMGIAMGKSERRQLKQRCCYGSFRDNHLEKAVGVVDLVDLDEQMRLSTPLSPFDSEQQPREWWMTGERMMLQGGVEECEGSCQRY